MAERIAVSAVVALQAGGMVAILQYVFFGSYDRRRK